MDQRDNLVTAVEVGDVLHQATLQQRLFAALGLDREAPFTGGDLTAGTENELATSVGGNRAQVDLPRQLLESPHAESLSPAARSALAQWLRDNPEQHWEYSWLQIARDRLQPSARAQLEHDLAGRVDRADFVVDSINVRIPPSYVLKLALIDACHGLPEPVTDVVHQVAACFLNDNTAPEIISTHVVSGGSAGLGEAVARENAQRFLLTQLLTAYANERFGLAENGQTLTVYGAPNPPQRLKTLSRLLPGDYYRELFMNPCLAGFTDGAAKRNYMHLCHETLSRSRQHAQARLTAAGFRRPRVVERLVCDTSLLNNGTHLSLGSRALGTAYAAPENATAEKYLGDAASKVIEHFLPLFVGLYSGAPLRLAPNDLKPERALGFLPHELSAPFLRFTWQSWKRKAGLLASLKGDLVPDARLLDYFAALPSLPSQASLDGRRGNGERLKQLLEEQGVYSHKMTVYALYRLRERAKMGYSGFEGRHYSLFASFSDDLAPAAELQALVSAVAYRYLAHGEVTHAQIPDDAETESERRQLFFAASVGLPVAYVRRASTNRFLLRLLAHTRRTRPSKRHPQYYKVYLDDYRAALLRVLTVDAEPILDAAGRRVLDDLRHRIALPEQRGATGSLTRGILGELGAVDPMDVDAATFNFGAERYYRNTLRARQLAEGVEACTAQLADTLRTIQCQQQPPLRHAIQQLVGQRHPMQYVVQTSSAVLRETANLATLRAWIGLILANVSNATPV
ncbi:MAG TPA: hypothetical protein DIC36_09245 [Gammaproteobacteria bacterium]|nr:hypothetical protein [Gammaproteobacteria bacterium]